MENLQWIFDGIGTELLSLAIGAIGGGLAGYKIGVRKSGQQYQIAKSSAKQRQEMTIDGVSKNEDRKSVDDNIIQTQKAGKNSEQVQIGRISNGK